MKIAGTHGGIASVNQIQSEVVNEFFIKVTWNSVVSPTKASR